MTEVGSIFWGKMILVFGTLNNTKLTFVVSALLTYKIPVAWSEVQRTITIEIRLTPTSLSRKVTDRRVVGVEKQRETVQKLAGFLPSPTLGWEVAYDNTKGDHAQGIQWGKPRNF